MQIIDEIEKLINIGAKKAGIEESFSVSFSNMPKLCDFQCNNCFAVAKKYNMNPFELANKIVSQISSNKDFVIEVAKPAFINIKLTDKKLAELVNTYLKDDLGGLEKHKQKQNST